MAAPAAAQQAPQYHHPGQESGRPDQPVEPRHPTLHTRPGTQPTQQASPQPPFVLDAQQQEYVDWVLTAWEQRSSQVKTFTCSFVRREYDEVFGQGDEPTHTDYGEMRYQAPDKGLFWVREPDDRQERWVCDGNSIFEFNFVTKKLTEHELPPELRGRAIANSPLPFLFGATAESLRNRYFLRLVTPSDRQNEVWLQAYPRFREDAANFARAELILAGREMTPFALQLYLPNGKTRLSYVFQDIKVNATLTNFLQRDPFRVSTPIGWERVVERAQPSPAGRPGPEQR
jgi:TIGR03009 family protein